MYSENSKGEYYYDYYKAVIKWNTSTLLTVHHQHNPFTDRWRYAVRRYAQIRSHVRATDSCQIQNWSFDAVHCNKQTHEAITLYFYSYILYILHFGLTRV